MKINYDAIEDIKDSIDSAIGYAEEEADETIIRKYLADAMEKIATLIQ